MKVYRLARHLAVLSLLVGSVGVAAQARAQTPEEVRAIIADRADAYGASAVQLTRVASCETGATFSPTAVGDSGNSLGLFQLNRNGLLPRFYAMGYGDPFNAYESADFAAWAFSHGLAAHWSCR